MSKLGTLVCLLILLAVSPLVASVMAQEVLTNDGVVAMKKAGLSDAVILAKIRGSASKFDVSTQALVGLKAAGLSDQLIEAMVTHTGVPGSPAATTSGPRSGPDPGQSRQGVFHVRGEQYIELSAAVASLESNFGFYQSKSEIVLKGRSAVYRVGDRQPVFLSAWAPNEVPLVKLKPGDKHDDRNLKFSSGSFAPFGGTHKMGVRSEDIIVVESEKDARGFYRIRPRQPLPAGEYGFILTGGFAGAAGGGKIYDFGVD